MVQIEPLLQDARLRYTKEVDEKGSVQYSLPFNSPAGILVLYLLPFQDHVVVLHWIRALDSIGAPSVKPLLREFLILNGTTKYARVLLWNSPVDEADCIAVQSSLPTESLTATSLSAVISETVGLAEKAIQAIAACVGAPQPQLK